MTAGTVVIIGGLLAAFILLTIVSVLCYCRLQYYCCKEADTVVEEEEDSSSEEEVEEEEEPEEEETDLSLSPEPPSPPDYFTRPYTPPPSGPPSPPYFSKHILTVGGLEANGPSCLPCGYPPYRGIRRPPGYALCPSCTGLLPHHLHRHEGLRNGGGRVSYQHPHHEYSHHEVYSDQEMFRKSHLIRWVAMHGVVAHRSFSTEV